MQQTLGLTDTTYRIALTILYVPYITLEIPSNLLFKKIGPHIFLPTLVTLWGIVSTLQVPSSLPQDGEHPLKKPRVSSSPPEGSMRTGSSSERSRRASCLVSSFTSPAGTSGMGCKSALDISGAPRRFQEPSAACWLRPSATCPAKLAWEGGRGSSSSKVMPTINPNFLIPQKSRWTQC